MRSYTAAREPSLPYFSIVRGVGVDLMHNLITLSHLINSHFFHIWPSSPDETRGRTEFSIINIGRILKLNQRSLATRAPSLTSFSGLQYPLCNVSHANVIQGVSIFSKTLSGR